MDNKSGKNQPTISSIVCKNAPFLCTLARTKSARKRHRLLRLCTSEQLLALAEVCLNIVKSKFKLTTRQKSRLMPYAHFVRRLSKARSERGARKVLIQKGAGAGAAATGLFAALLTPILLALSRGSAPADRIKDQISSDN